ncbi:uclacyanin-3-like [Macadamia integrifolia]|uniref:uclacyanin-3-like n=1 Tax=Macadamia integrifolia TaxID=60698 RepID=UPI001C52B1FA|nr:uclacyanin-3-like [Macadamia integrifolia]
MGRQVVWAVAAVVAIAALNLQCAVAKTTHVVGDSLGWTVPPGGAAVYSTWASKQSFTVGDVLLFNFTTGTHDVAEVKKAGYDSCDGSSTIGSVQNTGPTSINLSSAGESYYICTFSGHCSLGQKLALNVTATSTPASPPTLPPTPPPVKAASPPLHATPPASLAAPPLSPAPHISPAVPSVPTTRSNETYVVGDSLGWTVPTGGAAAYATWAAGKTFLVGDTLVFNFTTGKHTVAEVTKAGFDSCSSNSIINGTLVTKGPAKLVLKTKGEHYYICTIPQHCQLGQKLALNVTGSTSSSPSPSPSPSSSSPSASNSAPSSRFGVTTFSVAFLTSTILAFFL